MLDWKEFIDQKPEVLCGKPVIKGTRLSVELLLEKMAGGYSETDLLAAYPRLRSEDTRAALAFAARSLSFDEQVFLDSDR